MASLAGLTTNRLKIFYATSNIYKFRVRELKLVILLFIGMQRASSSIQA